MVLWCDLFKLLEKRQCRCRREYVVKLSVRVLVAETEAGEQVHHPLDTALTLQSFVGANVI